MAAERSCSEAAGFRSGRLVSRTPGTVLGSMQWSPLHKLVLFSITSTATAPSAEPFEQRVPFA
jgi:hypothetical protein